MKQVRPPRMEDVIFLLWSVAVVFLFCVGGLDEGRRYKDGRGLLFSGRTVF